LFLDCFFLLLGHKSYRRSALSYQPSANCLLKAEG
jgi:hypothetical protein